MDRWEGTFPSEDAASAWAAIDALAHRYVRDGVCSHIEAARGKALTDLVAGRATIDTVLTITVPATGLTADTGLGATAAVRTESIARGSGSDDLVEVTGPAGNQPVFVSRAWVTAMATPSARPGSRARTTPPPEFESGPGSRSQVVEVAPCHPHTGALVDTDTGIDDIDGHRVDGDRVHGAPEVGKDIPVASGANPAAVAGECTKRNRTIPPRSVQPLPTGRRR